MDQRHLLYQFRRSRYCASGGCVEVADAGNAYLVRDSKDPESSILAFALPQWREFVTGIRAGDFEINGTPGG